MPQPSEVIATRITNSAVSMGALHSLSRKHTLMEKLRVWVDARPTPTLQPPRDRLDLSGKAKEAMRRGHVARACTPGPADDPEDLDLDLEGLSPKDRQTLLLLRYLFKAVTGKELSFRSLRRIRVEIIRIDVQVADPGQTANAASQEQVRQGWGLEYDRQESYQETETLRFAASGVIRTADGREISFEARLDMSRQFIQENSVSIRAGDARLTDPLVVNFEGTAADLAGAGFSFDLDADGMAEQVPSLGGGSGFLAVDSNGDGAVSSGAELFGPRTGNGFAELASYDQDKNSWIDENDPVYGRLRIWVKGADGKDALFTLAQKGVGGIYLGNADAPFTTKSQENKLLGANRRIGIFVREDGTAGTVQQIDVVV